MADAFPCLFPHIDFTALDDKDPDDTGKKCRVVDLEKGKHQLRIKGRMEYVPIPQALFPTARAAMIWAIQRHVAERNVG